MCGVNSVTFRTGRFVSPPGASGVYGGRNDVVTKPKHAGTTEEKFNANSGGNAWFSLDSTLPVLDGDCERADPGSRC